MRELVERLQDTIEALKRQIVRHPESDEYCKALRATGRTPHYREANSSA
jgi:hypothetical protein